MSIIIISSFDVKLGYGSSPPPAILRGRVHRLQPALVSGHGMAAIIASRCCEAFDNNFPAACRRSVMLPGLDIKQYSTLLDKLYEGPFEEVPFLAFLDELRALLELNFATLILRQPNSHDPGMQFMSGLNRPPTSIHSGAPNASSYYALDPLHELPENQVIALDELIPRQKLEQTEFYKQYLQNDDLYHVIGIDLCDSQGRRFALRLCRPQSGHSFSHEERELIATLASHVCRAVANGVKSIQLESERQFYARATFARTIGSITLDEPGYIVQCNDAAERFLGEKDGVARLHNQIHLKNTELNETLRQQIQIALKNQRSEIAPPLAIQAMSVPRPSGKPDYELVVKPLPVDRYIAPSHTPHLIVFISSPAEKIAISTKTLMTLYHLTHTEATLTILLAEGKTLDEVTQELNIARNTARAHLRAIFSKTGVTQQSMLVSLVLKSLASIAPQ